MICAWPKCLRHARHGVWCKRDAARVASMDLNPGTVRADPEIIAEVWTHTHGGAKKDALARMESTAPDRMARSRRLNPQMDL